MTLKERSWSDVVCARPQKAITRTSPLHLNASHTLSLYSALSLHFSFHSSHPQSIYNTVHRINQIRTHRDEQPGHSIHRLLSPRRSSSRPATPARPSPSPDETSKYRHINYGRLRLSNQTVSTSNQMFRTLSRVAVMMITISRDPAGDASRTSVVAGTRAR